MTAKSNNANSPKTYPIDDGKGNIVEVSSEVFEKWSSRLDELEKEITELCRIDQISEEKLNLSADF